MRCFRSAVAPAETGKTVFDHHTHHHHHYGRDGAEVPPWAVVLQRQNDLIIKRLETIMATLADLNAAVARNTDAENAALEYLKGISQQLKDAQAANDPAALDAVIASIDANTAKAAAAIVQNTPAA